MQRVVDVTFRSDLETAGFEVTTWRALRHRLSAEQLGPVSRPDFYFIIHMTEGGSKQMLDFHDHRITRGDSLFVCKGQVHQFDLRSKFDAILVLFTEEFLYRSSPRSIALADTRLFNYHLHPPLVEHKVAKAEKLDALFGSLLEEYGRSQGRSLDVLHHWLELLLLKSERAIPAVPATRISGRDYTEFMRFKNLVEAEFMRTRRAEDYAQRMGCSLKALNALCRRATGRTVKVFIDERTVLEIRRHLSLKDKSVKELTFALGFEDASNLVKYVKRLTGKTPTELA